MRSLARPSFFRVFELLLAEGNPGLKRGRWSYEGVAFERERHSFNGAAHGFAIEIVTATREGRRGCPRSGTRPEPQRPIWPVSSARLHSDRTLSVPLWCSVMPSVQQICARSALA
jgi:hypothetical protein